MATHGGLRIREAGLANRRQAIRVRAVHDQHVADECRRFLPIDTDAGGHEREKLAPLLTIGEGHFRYAKDSR
jgi:hypothetical protein